jgi:hypothetical protein
MPYVTRPEDKDDITAPLVKYSTTVGGYTGNVTVSNNVVGNITIANNATSTCSALGAYPPPGGSWSSTIVRVSDDAIVEHPLLGKPAYFASIVISEPQSRHHWEVFTKLHPEINFLFAGVASNEQVRAVGASSVLFFSPSDHETFERWLIDYATPFKDKETLYSNYFPPPPEVMNYSVRVEMTEKAPVSLSDLAVWLIKNCNGDVYALEQHLFFLNDDDATLFKLKYS